ncbi:hypothetical protein AtNW77_Chr1g0080791 [Arabidopsis thaliana]
MAVDAADRREVIVKIDGENGNNNGVSGETVGKIWRDGSYDFWTDGEGNLNKGHNAAAVDSDRSAATTGEQQKMRVLSFVAAKILPRS